MEQGRHAVKIQPLILLSLSISAGTMGLFAYMNYSENHPVYGTTFVFLCLLFITLVVWGIVRNCRVRKASKDQNR